MDLESFRLRVEEPNRQPHSAELYLLYRVPEKPCFLYSDVNLFGGVSLFSARLADGRWEVEENERVRGCGAELFGWIPEGTEPVGEVVCRAPGGCIVRIPR